MKKTPIEIPSSFRGDIRRDTEILEKFSEDTSIFKIRPTMVVQPKDVSDLNTLIHYVHTRRGELSLTARSAGTDMSGGPLTDSIVVDMTRYFNQVHAVNTEFAVTQPGVYYRDFEKKLSS